MSNYKDGLIPFLLEATFLLVFCAIGLIMATWIEGDGNERFEVCFSF